MKSILLPSILFTLVFCGYACQTSRLPERLAEQSPYLFLPCKGHLSPQVRQQFAREKQALKRRKPEKTGSNATRFSSSLHLSETLDLTGNLTP